MKLGSTSSLKPLDLAGTRPPARSHLLPTDMSDVLTHSRRGRPATAPLVDHGRPGHPGRPNTPHDPKLVDQTRKWVAQTFFGTMLKQMRNSPFKSPLFEGGRGGEAFGELSDQHMVDHMSRGVGNKLVMAIVRKIESRGKKPDAAKAGAAYARQSILGPRATSAPGRTPQSKDTARHFAEKRRAAAQANASPLYHNVRTNVATGL
jgi:hypothetical protein